MNEPLQHQAYQFDLVFATCAITQLGYLWTWDNRTDELVFQVEGEDTPKNIALGMIGQIFDETTLNKLGRKIIHVSETQLRFAPCSSQAVVPKAHFSEALAIGLARQMLDSLANSDMGTCPVIIKWFGRILWQGRLAAEHTMAVLQTLLRFALAPVMHGIRQQFVYLSPTPKTAHPDMILGDMRQVERRQAVMLTVLPVQSGGGGTKQQIKVAQQTAMASMLLQQGYPLSWVADAVNRLIQRLSPKRIEQVTNMPAGGPRTIALEQLVQETGMEFPTLIDPARTKPQPGTPWNKAKQKRLQGYQLDVTGYQLMAGFFQNVDGSDASQLQHVKPQASGICLMNHSQAPVDSAWSPNFCR